MKEAFSHLFILYKAKDRLNISHKTFTNIILFELPGKIVQSNFVSSTITRFFIFKSYFSHLRYFEVAFWAGNIKRMGAIGYI
jgi:hypothetical protein